MMMMSYYYRIWAGLGYPIEYWDGTRLVNAICLQYWNGSALIDVA